MPGVSSNTNWAVARVRMPRRRWRVVWATGEVMATLCPTNRLSRVDLPTLGRPIRATKPERYPGVGGATVWSPLIVKDPAWELDKSSAWISRLQAWQQTCCGSPTFWHLVEESPSPQAMTSEMRQEQPLSFADAINRTELWRWQSAGRVG